MNGMKEMPGCWIWGSDGQTPNQYVQFLQDVILEQVPECELRISVDSNYAVWINGKLAAFGQYHDFPEHKIYDAVPVGGMLRTGKNRIAVLAYYCGKGFSNYVKGIPMLRYGLCAGERVLAESGDQTLCRQSRGYRQGEMEWITSQLGFPFAYDARREDGWNLDDYQPEKGWQIALPVENHLVETLEQRPNKKLPIGEELRARIQAQGVFRRSGRGETLAEQVYYDYLSPRERDELFEDKRVLSLPCREGLRLKSEAASSGEGIYLELDLGREEAGLLHLDVDAPEGTVIDVAYGQHLEDLRVWSYVGNRNFVHRYVCRAGRQSFVSYFNRLGGRYLELHIGNVRGDVTLYSASLLPTDYPVEERGLFRCADSLHEKICATAKHTLHLCMHEHYEDTPWREQSLYAMDSRNQALCGYYCFGEYQFPRAAFSLFLHDYITDGYAQLCAPCKSNSTIPYFTYMWIVECGEYVLYSGDTSMAEKVMPAVKECMSHYFSQITADGLMGLRDGGRFWNFYEWAEGLDGCGKEKDSADRLDAPLSMFFTMALENAALMADCTQDRAFAEECREKSRRMKRRLHEVFWDEARQAYLTYRNSEQYSEHYAELVQALAICTGVCPAPLQGALRRRLLQNDDLVKVTISHSVYKYEALLMGGKAYVRQVMDEVKEKWGAMLFAGTTTFWETEDSLSPFKRGYSLCHGWTATPIYLYYAYLLGVKPTSPGFKTFTFLPLADCMERVEGKIPTPYGDIKIKAGMVNTPPQLEYPSECRPE